MPDITKGKIFTSGETVTASEMNSLIDDAVINSSAITESKIAAGAVTNAKIASSAGIGLDKLASGADGQIPICSATGVPTYVTLTGATVTNAGVVSLDANSVDSDQYVDGSIDTVHLSNDSVTADKLSDTTVTPGEYTLATVTFDQQGRATAAASGTAGTVLQVVTAVVTANTFVSTSTSMVDVTGLSASITPASTSNKILVQVMASVGGNGNGGVIAGLKRGTTQIGSSTNATGVQQNGIASTMFGGDDRLDNLTMIYEDSPATTSSTTYQVTAASGSTSYNVRLNRPDTLTDSAHVYHGISTITLTEIAG